MSATAEETDQEYFLAIEAAFVRLRGTPFLLSPADWRLAQDWHRRGIPLAVVDEALAEVFARRAARGEGAKVQSLRYCRHAVEEAWAARRELGAGAASRGAEPLPVAARLASLAAALPSALSDAFGPRILGAGTEPAAAEEALAELDRELVGAARAELSREEAAAVATEVEAALARLGERLPVEELAACRSRLLGQAVRRRAGLPLLSLFSPDADPGPR